MKTFHIEAEEGQIAKTVLMPGDPMRAKYIAEHYLTDVICYSQVRGMNGYTGYYNGKKVSVQGSGMGIPSMGIYSYELFNTFGVDQIIRVGTCGAVNRDVEVGSLILAMGCCSNSNFASQYHLPGIFAPLADYGLLESAVNQARILEAPFYVGNVSRSLLKAISAIPILILIPKSIPRIFRIRFNSDTAPEIRSISTLKRNTIQSSFAL